jgi:HK97 gp10 family phage protein
MAGNNSMRIDLKADAATADLLKKMVNIFTPGSLAHSAGAGADVIAAEVRRLAPGSIANAVEAGVHKTGIAFMACNSDLFGMAFVRINYKKAPHAHLVEYGTAGARFPKKKKHMKFKNADGKWVTKAEVRPMPAHPFLRPAMEAKRAEVLAAIDRDLQAWIDKQMGRR